ncbi:MAG: hypothetical protein ACTSRH_15215 [Promethearchaeota archaeon]
MTETESQTEKKEKLIDKDTMLDFLYAGVKGLAGLGLSLFADLKIEGKNNIPLRGKAILTNETSDIWSSIKVLGNV